jgi:hypothetical protein
MRLRIGVVVAAAVAALAITSSALAFDCIRVSSSYQGLVNSTANSGNWLLFDLTSPTNVFDNLSAFGVDLTPSQAECISDAYQAAASESGTPLFFALGIGVAGPNGVLAGRNPDTQGQLGNLRGIDHLDESPVGATLFGAAASCGVDVSD